MCRADQQDQVRLQLRGDGHDLLVQVRVAAASPASAQYAMSIATELGGMGIRTELDDRGLRPDVAARDADSLLVPYLVLADASQGSDHPAINVRDFTSGAFRVRAMPDLAAEIEKASANRRRPANFTRLSRTPFCS